MIVSDQGALPERIRAAEAGIVVGDVDEAVAAVGQLVRDPDLLGRLQEAAARYRHRSLAEMAADYRLIYASLLGRTDRVEALDARGQRHLRAAHAAAEGPGAPPPAPVAHPVVMLPHYDRRWYRHYLRIAPLVPAPLRRFGRRLVAQRWWRTIARYDFTNGGAVRANDGLELLRASRGGARFRAVHDDPWFVLPAEPFPTRDVRVIRFDMRCETDGPTFAQLYWSHRDGEHFSEAKSLRIPLAAGDGAWHEYTVLIDRSDSRDLWDAAEQIHALRFDPVNAPSTIELRDLRLCSAAGDE